MTRKVAGVLLNGITSEAELTGAPWDKLITVALGIPVPHLPLHAVDTDPAQALEMAWEALRVRGCKRIALVHLAEFTHVHNAERCGRFLWLQHLAPPSVARLPIIHSTFSHARETVHGHLRELKPDGVIGVNDLVYWLLKEAGHRIPQKVQFVSLSRDVTNSITAGISTEDVECARAGVEFLDLLVARRATGLPAAARLIHVAPTWCDGPSLRPLPSS